MEVLIAWCAFLGAWLLVAGPLLQAAMELREQDVQTEQLEQANNRVAGDFPPVSRWWWLLPPVGYWLHRRRANRQREAVMRELSTEQLGGLLGFINTATGWLFVAAGAALIAVKETWELVEAQHWPHALFWVLIVVMLVICTSSTVARVGQTDRALGRETGRRRR